MLKKIIDILKEEIVPAEGCTEPIALAYLGSKLTSVLGGIPEKIKLFVSGNIIKNVKSVKIPNSNGMVGIEAAVALGTILGDSTKELMVISNVDTTRLDEVKNYILENRINIEKSENNSKLYMMAVATLGSDTVTIEIKDYHTNITKIEKNGEIIHKGLCDEVTTGDVMTDRDFLSVELIYKVAKEIDINLIKDIFEKVIEYNSNIANAGLETEYGVAIGKAIKDGISEGVYGNDLKNNIVAFASAGSDARMNGCSLPVMTTSGSGNQGMTCSLPIIKFCELKGIDKETLIRGLFFSHMTTIHIKSNIGRLSAYCGVIAGGAAVSGGFAFVDGLSLEQVNGAIETTIGTLSGVICDGAKSSCATKIASSISMAFDSYYLAKKNRKLQYGEGIIGKNIEKTLGNVGVLAQEGLQKTDEVVLDIMIKN